MENVRKRRRTKVHNRHLQAIEKDESQYNLYNQSKILDKLIEKAENELKELNNE